MSNRGYRRSIACVSLVSITALTAPARAAFVLAENFQDVASGSDLAAANARLNDSCGLLKSGRGHPGSLGIIYGNQCLRKQKSDHNPDQYVRVPLTFVSMRYTDS